MNIWRMIVGSTVRAVVYRIVGLAFVIGAAAISGRAHAATFDYPDQGAAYAGCIAQGNTMFPVSTGPTTERRFADCVQSGNTYSVRYRNCEKGTSNCGQPGFTAEIHRWAGATCASRGTSTHSAPPFPTSGSGVTFQSGSMDCSNGCVRTSLANGDGTWTYSHTANLTCTVEQLAQDCEAIGMIKVFYGCQPKPQDCKPNQSKNPVTGSCVDACPTGKHLDSNGACAPDAESCPAGQIRSPLGTCLPGDGQCAAGEARRPNGTCGKDSNGDGVADDDDEDPENDSDKETFSGGDGCNSPPSCSGSPVMCGQARIQWRIECNTRKNVNISGGSCGAQPVCTGEKCNAMEYSQLLMQWRTACALERDSGGDGEQGEKIKPDFEALVGGGDGDDGQGSVLLPEGEAPSFSESLIAYGGTATGYSFDVEGQTFAMPQQVFDFVAMLRWLIIAAATVAAITIVWGNL